MDMLRSAIVVWSFASSLLFSFLFHPLSFHRLLLLLSSLLTTGPIFVLANLMVLAILISSGSFTLSDFFASIPYPLSRNLLNFLIWRKTTVSGVPETKRDEPQQAQRQPVAANPQWLTEASAIAQRASELWQGKHLSIDESKQALATSTSMKALLIRSKSDQGRSTAAFRETELQKAGQKAESMHGASVFPTALCDNLSSSMLVADWSYITHAGLNDDDFQRKCEDFIAKFRANIQKEAVLD